MLYVSNPTWGNHISIAHEAGLEVKTYPFWSEEDRGLDFTGTTLETSKKDVDKTTLETSEEGVNKTTLETSN